MTDSCHPGDCGIHSRRNRSFLHLQNAARSQHHDCQIQSHMIGCQYASGPLVCERKTLLKYHQEQEEQHPQNEIMGMDESQGCPSRIVIVLGKLPVEHAARHRHQSVENRCMDISLQVLYLI